MDENIINEEEPIVSEDNAIEVLPEKVEIVGVRFKKSGKVYYFDPCGVQYFVGNNVIVKTARGLEFGTIASCNQTVNSREIVLPLRAVVRLANADDEARHEANVESEREAMRICSEKIEEHNLDMKLVDVEYTFDNNKLLFYFTSDGRVDFRDLVKDLAGVFKTRIELRQIGIRDETKLVGGLGVCGRPFCCASFLTDFSQVSIKMAKEQNLSLNSAKISGACGKLMCCLKYEHDVYVEELKKTPKVDSEVTTPDGTGVVIEANPLAGLVKVKLDSEQNNVVKVYSRDDINRPSYPKKEEEKPEPIAVSLEQEKLKKDEHIEKPQNKNGNNGNNKRINNNQNNNQALNNGNNDAEDKKIEEPGKERRKKPFYKHRPKGNHHKKNNQNNNNQPKADKQ